MPVLDCPVTKESWLQEVRKVQASCVPLAEGLAGKPLEDAGPWQPAVQEILSYQQLGDNWDGLGAVAPSSELLACAIGLAYLFSGNGVEPPLCVVPGLGGSVDFEWQDPDGSVAEVEIDRPFRAEVMVIEPGQPAKLWTLPRP